MQDPRHNDVAIMEKLDELIKDFKAYQETMKPILDAYTTANKLGDGVIWVSKVILAFGVIIGVVIAAIKLK